jgi:hypothetical protein
MMVDLSGIRVGDMITLRRYEDCAEDRFPVVVTELNPGNDGKPVVVGDEWFSELGEVPSWIEHVWWQSTGESVIADLQGHDYDIVAYRHPEEVQNGET